MEGSPGRAIKQERTGQFSQSFSGKKLTVKTRTGVKQKSAWCESHVVFAGEAILAGSSTSNYFDYKRTVLGKRVCRRSKSFEFLFGTFFSQTYQSQHSRING